MQEYVVVGSGAGGATAAYELTKAGRRALLVEEGERFDAPDFRAPTGLLTQRLYRFGGVQPILGWPAVAFAEGCCLGGSTEINGGLLWRTPKHILDEWENRPDLRGISRWLEPHFAEIEQWLSATPTRPESLSNLDSELLRRGAESLGWKAVYVPRAVRGCQNLNRCATGCTSGAKQSMGRTLIPRAEERGLSVLCGHRVVRLRRHTGGWDVIAENVGTKERTTIRSRYVVLAAGAVQTPHLLAMSGLVNCLNSFQFHLNLKSIVEFPTPIHASNGTIFTVQVQEFQERGTLIMASNWTRAYAALAGCHFGKEWVDALIDRFDWCAGFTTQIRSRSTGRIVSRVGSHPLLCYRLDPRDVADIRSALKQSCELFFRTGAKRVFLPISASQPVSSQEDAKTLIDRASPSRFQLVSLHVMASLPISHADARGRIAGVPDLWIADASLLPSNIGESPQGTIMAFAREMAHRNLAEAKA